MTKIHFVFFDAGGGHRSAANALRTVMDQEKSPWEIHMMNLQEVLEPIDVVRKLTGICVQDVYNQMLKKQWTLATPPLNRILHAAIRLFHSRQVDLLEKYWRDIRPDIVVSLIPHFNRAILQSLRRVSQYIPFVTIMTDIADYSPHFWIEPQEQYLICGSQRAIEQAQALGYPKRLLFQTSGMIIHPRFYEPMCADRQSEMRRIGLNPELATGLVMFGGHGSRAMVEVSERLDVMGDRLQLICICGHNKALAESLERQPSRLKKHIVGFTNEVPYYMRLCDFFVGKPGPGSISEALALQLPVIVERNASTLPQERYNAQWIEEKQVGIVLRNFRSIVWAVSQILETGRLGRFRANAAAINNRAVFEIPRILRGIAEGTHYHQPICA